MNYDLNPIPHPLASGPAVDPNDRESLIRWLSWNDGNGFYSDEQSRAEGADPITLEEARFLYRAQTRELFAFS